MIVFLLEKWIKLGPWSNAGSWWVNQNQYDILLS